MKARDGGMAPGDALRVTLDEERGAKVAFAEIHGQKSLNLIDGAVMRGATDGLRALLDAPELRCVVLSGRDEKAFVGGANLNALRALDPASAESFIRSIHDFCDVLRRARVPVIGMLRGYCIGAGLEIAAACDLRIGDPSVRCAMPEVQVGVPSVIEAALLPGLIGWGKTRELLLRGNMIEADESERIGFLQHVVAADALRPLALSIADDILGAAPEAIAAQKRLCLAWEDDTVSAAIERGVRAFVEAYAGDEPATYAQRFFARRANRT